ncbi:MAG: hypothetical protein H0T76_20840 [Nannocystis sp.]|nr:hypothetical protein [Nannocystis sp.]MBA3548937.1 hypothetical protein [Nannocystis sp.]
MRVSKQHLTLVLFALAACPGAGKDGETDGATDTDGVTAGTTDGTTGGATDVTTGSTTGSTTATTGVDGDSLCGAPPAYSDPGTDEYFQWVIDGTEYVSLPPAGGAYFFNSYLSVALYASNLTGSLSFSAISPFPDGIKAGTYTCSDPEGFSVNGGALGLANGQAAGSSCVIRFTEDASDGGRLVGTLSARLVDVLSGKASACVDGRFALTDAP